MYGGTESDLAVHLPKYFYRPQDPLFARRSECIFGDVDLQRH